MTYTIVEEDFTSNYLDNVYKYAIKENNQIMDRAETLEEAQRLREEMERYDEQHLYLENEVPFLLDQFRNKFDLTPREAEVAFLEFVNDWL